ncbi:hypothetical protein E4T48_00770 [Aureobasidium sp. EXF-10727]|nr:hypothetical protein E4T48_00770 [Aureobasidium sp. EXF-10727]KAI4732070.1 hypothetical protein E4T49_00047 [Aureobasidium sp. EXF-10728]
MSARRFSGPPAPTVVIKIDAARPRAKSESEANYGSIGSSPEERRVVRAIRVQAIPYSNQGLAEKSWLLPLLESPFIPSPIPEEQEQPSEKGQDLIVTDKEELEWLACAQDLPPQLGTETTRRFWDFFSLYRLIFAFTILANLLATTLAISMTRITSSDAATGAAINLCIAILVRNEHVVNAMFRSVCTLKPSAPLSVRRIGAKVYSYGGFHSGCATAGTLWYLAFTILLGVDFRNPDNRSAFTLAAFVSILLLAISLSALPAFRVSHHNTFEAIHRYAGWTCIGLLWAQLGASVFTSHELYGESPGFLLAESPLFWCLIVITLAIIYPWSRLREREVRVQVLSPAAALLHFDYKRMDTCQGIRITDSPLKETHSFATISGIGDEQGFRVLMSRAGDWTSHFIDNPPTRIWVKGAPVYGVMRVALMFKKVLVVATGTGIGPCLSLLESCPEHPMHVLWMSSNPRESFGDAIIDSVYTADSGACIVDTSKAGRGDIVRLAYARYVESQSEAIIIISNAKVTRMVVGGLECRGIPAFGAIFDS